MSKDAGDGKASKPQRTPEGAQGRTPGPWEIKAEAPPRPPVFRRRPGGRTPIINSWGGLVAVILLLFVAPPLIGWLSRIIIAMIHGG